MTRAICGAKTRKGTPCQGTPMANGRCRMHGGASLSGIASPSYIHGRYSKKLPNRLAERFAASMSDPDLLALTPEIALLDSRIDDLLGRVDSGESGRLWRELHEHWREYVSARARGDVPKMAEALSLVELAINRGVSDGAAWDELRSLTLDRGRLVAAERKRRLEMQSLLTVEEAMLALSTFVETVRIHVTDRTVLAKIAADFERQGARLGLALRD